jgi:hypothetical protein
MDAKEDKVCNSCHHYSPKPSSTLGFCKLNKDKPKGMNKFSKACDKHKSK